MKKVKKFFKNYYFLFAPFLISTYSVLFLYVKNQHEYPLKVIWTPFVISLILAFIIFGILKIIFRKTTVAVIISSVTIFICLSYGRFLEIAHSKSYLNGIAEIVVGIAVGLFFILTIIIALKFRNKLLNLCKILSITVLALVFIQVVQTVYFEFESGRINRQRQESVPIKTDRSKAKDSYPDIYYIMPDRYAGQRALLEQYDFDNSKFLDSLEKKGFYVTKNSTANYPKTFLSLGSTLHMDYFHFLTDETDGGGSKDESIVTPYIQNSKVLQFLKDHGYSYVHIGSWWEPTKKNENADYVFFARRKEHWGADEFTTGFYNTTIASELLKTFFKEPTDVSKNPQDNLHRQAVLQQFEELKKIPKMPGPKFVFMHVLFPHDPFVFDENCTPISEQDTKDYSHQENYINQVKCANIMLEEAVDHIVKNSKNPPVIILQSDEGPFPMNSPVMGNQSWKNADATALNEKFPILNAYYFPGKNPVESGIYDSITPVNSFRVLFNTYFNESFPLLEDRNYIFEDDENYYKFRDVTDIVR